jgi:lipoate-protein ligase A
MWPQSLRFVASEGESVAGRLAHEEALLNAVECDSAAAALMVWESSQYAVVVGRSNAIEREVNVPACEADSVPILRRSSGGGAVLIGPGCLCFALALPIPAEFPALGISGVTQAVMQRLADGLRTPFSPVAVRGISDLAVNDRKICGNAQRWRRRAFLHHGSLLYDFDLPRISQYLLSPSRQPEYRRRRSHSEFVMNLARPRGELIHALCASWNAGRERP